MGECLNAAASLRSTPPKRKRGGSREGTYLVGVVADGSAAEAFFLEDEPFVQDASALLIGCTEVHIVELLVSLVDEMAQQQVESAVGPALVAARHVLHMRHLSALEDDDAGYDALLVAHDVELDILWELAHEQSHLLHCMRRRGVVMLHEDVLQECPILPQRLRVALRHAVDVEAVVHSLACLLDARRPHLHRVPHRYTGADEPPRQSCPGAEQGVEIFS